MKRRNPKKSLVSSYQLQHSLKGEILSKLAACDEKRLLKTLDHHLNSFGLSLERTVMYITDAAIMMKMDKLSNTEHQVAMLTASI